MSPEASVIVEILLRERLRVTAAAAAVARDVHSADDVFQQVVLSAIEHGNNFRSPDHLLAWALRSARHRAIDLTRHKQLHQLPDDVLDLLEADWGNPAGESTSYRAEALRRCVERLPEKSRAIVSLRYDRGLTTAAIAGKVRKSVDAVYQSLSRIHRALRECVDRQLAPGGVVP